MTQEEVHSTITADDVAISMHSGQEDYNWVITLNRYCLSVCGVWPESNETPRRKLMTNIRVIIILNIMIWSFLIPAFHSLIRIWGNIMCMIDNLQYTLPFFISIMKFVFLWRKKKVLIPILKVVKEDWMKLKSEKERAVMIKQARTARLIMIWGYFVMLVSFISFIILPSFNISMRYVTNITDPGKLMPMQTYYIYNVSKSPFYEITFILQSFSTMTGAIVYTSMDSFMGILIFHVCGQLENFKIQILNLNKFSHFEEVLSFSVQQHIRLIRFIKAIDDIFNLILLGLLLYFGILFIFYGFLYITILKSNEFSAIRIFFVMTTSFNTFAHTCLYCAIGEILVAQYEGIYKATCECEWYNLEPKKARNLIIIMMQANQSLHLTAGKLFPMTMSTFCNMLKTSGGYISVLLAYQA